MADPTPAPVTVLTIPIHPAVVAATTNAVAVASHFWQNKTFWANLIMVAAHYSSYLPASLGPWQPAIAIGVNLAMELLTGHPATS
jgi:hypothetical protein